MRLGTQRGAVCLLTSVAMLMATGALAQSPDPATERFRARCAGCHGADGAGGEFGPDIVTPRRQGGFSTRPLTEIITKGIPEAGMPAFSLSGDELGQLTQWIEQMRAPASQHPAEGDPAAGAAFFFRSGSCESCHTVAGQGGALGPDLTSLALRSNLERITRALHDPAAAETAAYRVLSVRLSSGETVRGLPKNENNYELQLMTLDGKIRLLQRSAVAEEVTELQALMPALHASRQEERDLMAYLTRLTGQPEEITAKNGAPITDAARAEIATPKSGDWPTYNGRLNGNRHSDLRQIDAANVSTLGARWTFPISASRRLEVTPVVIDGVMYVTAANQAYALDAASGREIWHYSRPLTKGVIGDASTAINRGVAILADKVFMVTDNAHLIALNRLSGTLVWDRKMADYREHYGATAAPLVVGDLVISGTSGGDEGARGFIDAYRASTGERAWRFWNMPAPGEPHSETWVGRAIEHGCVDAWLTGSWDRETNLLYWATGNPCPDFNGDERRGDNLFSDSVLALDPATGRLRWYYQFTPHDLHDWDAEEPLLLVDASYHGQPRKLILQANRNGFFYVLDRETGVFLSGTAFVQKMTWADGIGNDGRPRLKADLEPSVRGTKTCPAMTGATNWMSSAYSPETGLFYVMALEACSVYAKSSAWWKPGESFYGGAARRVPDEAPRKILRALDVQTGKTAWEVPQYGSGNSAGGVLSTAGGLIFYGDDSGAFAAVQAATGKALWHFNTNENFRASPMTYIANGRQYVAIAAGSNIIAFSLP